MSTPVMSARTQEAPNCARLTRTAEPIAKPFPMSAVVFSAASSTSVRSQTHSSSYDITTMPPALSEMGAESINCQSHCQCAKHNQGSQCHTEHATQRMSNKDRNAKTHDGDDDDKYPEAKP